eukprot:14475945-Alexandrium_andersonii.AAC.1
MVSQAAASASPKQAMGVDQIPHELWMRTPDEVVEDLARIFTSRLYGQATPGWGRVVAKLIPKGGQGGGVSAFRPIALTYFGN